MNNKKKTISLFIVDDHAMVREGLQILLNQSGEFEVIGETDRVESAFDLLNKRAPDVLLLDIRLKGQSGLDACGPLKKQFPEMKIVMLTSFVEPGMVTRALESGADGYLLKEIDGQQLCEHIRRVAQGETVIPGDVAKKLMTDMKADRQEMMLEAQFETLSPQERKIAAKVAEGLINKEIADSMNLTEKTVKNYMTNIFMKLGITRRSQLAVSYTRMQSKWADPE